MFTDNDINKWCEIQPSTSSKLGSKWYRECGRRNLIAGLTWEIARRSLHRVARHWGPSPLCSQAAGQVTACGTKGAYSRGLETSRTKCWSPQEQYETKEWGSRAGLRTGDKFPHTLLIKRPAVRRMADSTLE